MEGEKPLIEIRQMQQDDIAGIAAIEQLVNPSPWTSGQFQSELSNPGSRFDLLFADGELAAYLCSWKIVDELQIQNIATAPAFRRRGYAGMLLRKVLQKALREEVSKVFLEVRVGNRAARTLYEKFLFTASGIRSRYYSDNEDALLMELKL